MSRTIVHQFDAHLSRPPELITKDGKTRCVFHTMSNDVFYDANDEKQERTTSIRWVSFGRAGENLHQYLSTGSHVNVVGHMTTSPPKEEGGEWYTNFVADDVHYLDTVAESEGRREKQKSK